MVSKSSEFSVVPAEVTDAGRFVQLTAESLVNGLRSLDTDIEVLLEPWKGTSADAYGAGWTETKRGADTVLEALTVMAEMLGVTTQALHNHDQTRAEQTSSLELP